MTLKYVAVSVVALSLGLLPSNTSRAARSSYYDGSWSTYLFSSQHTGYGLEESIITPSNAAHLEQRWRLKYGSSISDQPVTWNGHLFWGSWDGRMHATTFWGKKIWGRFLGQTSVSGCDPETVGIASTATVISNILIGGVPMPIIIVGGGDGNLYALNANTGAVEWHTPLGTKNEAFLWSSPTVEGNAVYMGVSSFGDCPLVRGEVVKLNASTGAVDAIFYTTPAGCVGNGVWGSVTLDDANGRLYFVDGNDGACGSTEPYSESIVALDMSDLSLADYWSVPQAQRVWDSDFGSTPTLFPMSTDAGPIIAVGTVNKNGWYYAWNTDDLGAGPIWEDKVGNGGSGPQDGSADISPSSWDGQRLYIGSGITNVNGATCEGSLRAVDPNTGAYLWQVCLSGPVLGAVQTIPGLVEVAFGHEIDVRASATGKVLYRGQFIGATFWGPASISQGTIYQGGIGGTLYAISPKGAF